MQAATHRVTYWATRGRALWAHRRQGWRVPVDRAQCRCQLSRGKACQLKPRAVGDPGKRCDSSVQKDHQRMSMRPHSRSLPLRVGTRGSPLALVQTRFFLDLLTTFFPVLRGMSVFEEHAIRTTGDRVQDRPLADIGGKGLFAKEIHEALADRRVDFAVHSLKDLETELPAGIVL